jgi:hypothetical protein
MSRPTNPPSALIGSRYELVRELRVDPETVDWEGFDTKLDRPVIVRLLRPELSDDADAGERFWRATRADAQQKGNAPGQRVLDGGTDAETGRPFVICAPQAEAASLAGPPPTVAPARTAVSAPASASRLALSRRWVFAGAVVVGVLVLAALRPGVAGWLDWVNTTSARPDVSFVLPRANATSGAAGTTAVATPRVVAPTSGPTASPTRAPTATAAEAGQRRRIVNTDGQGVALRVAPGGDRFPGKGYDEGDTVQAYEQSGAWTRIRGADGREGWVLSVTLAP